MYYGFIDPLYNGTPGLVLTPETSIAGLQSQRDITSQALQQISLVSEGIRKVDSDYKKIDGELRKKVEIMLQTGDIESIKLANEVMAIGNKSGLAISAVSVDTKSSDRSRPGLQSYKVSFSSSGHYDELKKLLVAYEKNMRFYIPESIMIARPEKKENDNNQTVVIDPEMLTGTFVFRVYSLPKTN
jgi:hypothetical protein